MKIDLRHIIGILAAACCAPACCADAENASLKALYDAQNWSELSRQAQHAKGTELYRGAVAVVFHQTPRRAESLLRSVTRTRPGSSEAYEAYEWLSHLYLYSGQYARLISTMEARWSAFPGKPEAPDEKRAMEGFHGLPDQSTVSVRPSTLRHDPHSLFIPLTVNGTPAHFFFDTGAWLNVVSQSEAERLGLRFTENAGSMATMTSRVAFRSAVARTLVVGGVTLKNVSFTVLPDTTEPWSLLPAGRRGLIGIPAILAFRTLRWAQDGSMRIGEKPLPFKAGAASVIFDNDHLAVKIALGGSPALAALDTGAETTDFYSQLAAQFPSAVQSGVGGATEVRGVGGAQSYESLTLPEIAIGIGGVQAILRSREVLMKRSLRGYIGNLGMDVLEQGSAFRLDFTAMRLDIEPVR